MGDFNEVAFFFEKSSGRNQAEREAFHSIMADCDITDLGYNKKWYTWERGKFALTNIREQLDQGVANAPWWCQFPDFLVDHLLHSISDHCLILVSKKLPKKLVRLGHRLMDWNFKLKRDHKALHVLVTDEPTNETLLELLNIQLELNLEVDKEELDHNTTFFYKLATGRKCHNSIKGLKDEAKRWIEDENRVMGIVSNYFQDIFTALKEGEAGATFDKVQQGNRNEDVVHEIVEFDQVDVILSIPIAQTKPPDLEIWACLMCLEGTESVDHLLQFCPVTEQVQDFLHVTRSPVSKHSDHRYWLMDSFNMENGYIKELESISDESPLVCMPKTSYWRPPQQGTVKINFNSSFNVHGSKSFLGVIIRNKVCLIMGACTYPYSHVVDAFVAELRHVNGQFGLRGSLGSSIFRLKGNLLQLSKNCN
ncbi:hypothetical protein GOBAR_DD29539 [Gossypium barbadense]|nr:hypothetical protein GOBAR_DD29539 [Gossypium barbadense]